MLRRLLLVSGLLIGILSLFACGGSPGATPSVESPTQIIVDPVFREYYNYIGGEKIFGAPISPARKEGSATTQYLETTKLIFDPNAPPNSRFRLAPLGQFMGISEPASPPPAEPNAYYRDGHTIFPAFYPLYEKLGPNTVGKPLTEVRYNLIRRRYEQHFENLGFYQIEGTSEVRLLAYGAWVCGKKCLSSPISKNAAIDIQSYIDPAFQGFANQYGADFTGFALVDAYVAQDGKWEQILENVVAVADNRVNPQDVRLRPLSEKLNIIREEPRPKSADPNMYFYPLDGEKGYEIPLHFWEYIQDHGGFQLFGSPITHYAHLMNHIYHQCFVNLCLLYDPTVSEAARVRPEPLGYAYRVLYYSQTGRSTATPEAQFEPTTTVIPVIPTTPEESTAPVEATPSTTPFEPVASPSGGELREIAIQVWERFLVVEQKQGQEIGIWIVENDQPVAEMAAEITVKMPDGGEQSFQMPPTNSAGQSSLLLPVIQAPNGTIVPYKACILAAPEMRVCVADFFVIWNIP